MRLLLYTSTSRIIGRFLMDAYRLGVEETLNLHYNMVFNSVLSLNKLWSIINVVKQSHMWLER